MITRRRKMASHHEECAGCKKTKRKSLSFQDGNDFFCSKACLYSKIGKPKQVDPFAELKMMKNEGFL